MSGHSKWATTHRQKSAQDAKRGAVFTKLANLITIAAREGGADQNNNFKLRLAIDKAKVANMPKDNIERAVKRGSGSGAEAANLESVTYEIIGPSGSTFIAEAITDNKNRTIAELKSVLNKNNGQLGSPNSVLWKFERCGLIVIDQASLADQDQDDIELKLIDAGASNIVRQEDGWEIYTAPGQLQEVEKKIKDLGLTVAESSLAYYPKEKLIVTDAEAQGKIEQFYGALDDCQEINNVYTDAQW